MEQYFRVVILMLLLISTSSNPITKPAKPLCSNLPSEQLRQSVQCRDNLTFTSPTNVQEHCDYAALITFMKQLDYVRGNCTDEEDRITDALQVLDECPGIIQSPHDMGTNCTWENEGFGKQFANFTEALEKFIYKLNSRKAEKGNNERRIH